MNPCSSATIVAVCLSFLMIPNSLIGQTDTRRFGFEPFGAEDKGAEDNTPSIPEPLVFDLVRGLGAHQGEFEMNVLGLFPLNKSSERRTVTDFNPYGGHPSREDTGGIEWAPEIEYAIWDGVAVEFELPFEDGHLEAYKAAFQFTFGTAFDERFIHGTQFIIEPDTQFEKWDLTYLYLAGVQFNETWSTLAMLGLRNDIVDGAGIEHTDGIFNLSLFADVTERLTLGVESNFTFGESERTSLLVMPQLDFEITDQTQIQLGVGTGFSEVGTEPVAALRAIYSR